MTYIFFFRFCVAIIGPEIPAVIPDNNHDFPSCFENLTFNDFGDFHIYLSEKLTEVTSNGLAEIFRSPCRETF